MDFLVLSHPRSGTSYFCNGILSSHPKVKCYDEIFNGNKNTKEVLKELNLDIYSKNKADTPLEFLDILRTQASIKHSNKDCFGFKLFTNQLTNEEIISLISTLKVIILRRKNLAKSAISFEIAQKTGQWDLRTKKEFSEFRASISSLIKFCRYHSDQLNRYEKELQDKGISYLSLYYEDLFTQASLIECSDFLQIKRFKDNYPFKNHKLNSSSRYKRITNWQEVRKVLIEYNFGDIIA